MVHFVFGHTPNDVTYYLPHVYCVIVVSRACHALVMKLMTFVTSLAVSIPGIVRTIYDLLTCPGVTCDCIL